MMGYQATPRDNSEAKTQTPKPGDPNSEKLTELNKSRSDSVRSSIGKSASRHLGEMVHLPEHVMFCFWLRKLSPISHSSAAGPLSTKHARFPHELPYVLPFIRSWV